MVDDHPYLSASYADQEVSVQPGFARSPIAESASVRASTGVLERGQRTVSVPSVASDRSRVTLWIACIGARAYNSWPLAFLVNPSLAGSALASSFEARSEPFSWLFILLDCIAGLCTAAVCIRELRPRRGSPWPRRGLVLALVGYGVFGMATAVDAVVPLNCGTTSAQACASRLWPPTPDDFFTGTAVLALFVATATVIVLMTTRPVAFPPSVVVALTITLVVWTALGFTVLIWSTSGALAAADQYAYLTLTSILAFAVPLGATSIQRLRKG